MDELQTGTTDEGDEAFAKTTRPCVPVKRIVMPGLNVLSSALIIALFWGVFILIGWIIITYTGYLSLLIGFALPTFYRFIVDMITMSGKVWKA